MIYQALQFYPGFDRKIASIFQENLEKWKEVVQIAVDNGEIRPSCNVELIAQQFRYIYSGLSFERSILSGLNVEELQKLYYSIYNEIKYEK